MTVLAAQEVLDKDISRFGVIASHKENGVEFVDRMVEKPPKGQEPSRLVAYGRYLYTPEVFLALKETLQSHGGEGEFTQTDAINRLAAHGRVVVRRFEGKLLDVGTPLGYLEAFVEAGLYRDEYREPFREILKRIAKREKIC